MSDALLAVIIGGLIGALSAIFSAYGTNLFAERRERRGYERLQRKDRIALLQHLYQDALQCLHSLSLKGNAMSAHNDKEGTRKLMDEYASIQGRLALSSTQEIVDTFYLAMVIVSGTVMQEIQQRKRQNSNEPEEQYPPFPVVHDQLVQLMKAHLALVEKS